MRLGRPGQRFFFIDYETTGVDMEKLEPIEFGIVVTDEWLNVLATHDGLISHSIDVTEDKLRAFRIHGITPREANNDGENLKTVAMMFAKWAKGYTCPKGSKPVLVSDCLQFEWQITRRILKAIEVEIESVFHFCGWDTSLLLEASGVDDPVSVRHRALSDAGQIHRNVVRALERIGFFDRVEGAPKSRW